LLTDKEKFASWIACFNYENIPTPGIKDEGLKALVRDTENELESLLQNALEQSERM